MNMPLLNTAGILAILGAFLYSIGDVLLLAGKATIENHPRLGPYTKLLSGAEKMAELSSNRLVWGALLGVFSTPLILIGVWRVYLGLGGNSVWIDLVIFGLFGCASVIGAFVHGTFFYLGEYVQALEKVGDQSQSIITAMIQRHKKILIITYTPILLFILISSILYTIRVSSGETAFPLWMAGINPLTLTIAWLLIKRFLPRFIKDWTEGAGFNIAYLAFFVGTTVTLWK